MINQNLIYDWDNSQLNLCDYFLIKIVERYTLKKKKPNPKGYLCHEFNNLRVN